MTAAREAQLRAWLGYVIDTAIAALDALDGDADLEDDEREPEAD